MRHTPDGCQGNDSVPRESRRCKVEAPLASGSAVAGNAVMQERPLAEVALYVREVTFSNVIVSTCVGTMMFHHQIFKGSCRLEW